MGSESNSQAQLSKLNLESRFNWNDEDTMARRVRTVIPGMPLHIIQRGNNRQACFFADQDYQFYLECLQTRAN